MILRVMRKVAGWDLFLQVVAVVLLILVGMTVVLLKDCGAIPAAGEIAEPVRGMGRLPSQGLRCDPPVRSAPAPRWFW